MYNVYVHVCVTCVDRQRQRDRDGETEQEAGKRDREERRETEGPFSLFFLMFIPLVVLGLRCGAQSL